MRSDVETRLLLELALSIGKHPDLERMVERTLTELLRTTTGFGAVVFERTETADAADWSLIRSVPRELTGQKRYALAFDTERLEHVWTSLNADRASWYEESWEAGGNLVGFLLPDFGLLLLFTFRRQLSPSFCSGYREVAESLARACLYCVQRRELRRWAALEATLIRWSVRFIAADASQMDVLLNSALAEIGAFVAADRAYLFRYDFVEQTTSNTHEWCEHGISPELPNLQNVPLDGLDDWLAAHKAGAPFQTPDVLALPQGSPLREILEPQGIQTNVTIPLMGPDGCFGFVGFDAVRRRRSWGKLDTSLLQMMADIFANALIRQEQQTQIIQVQDQLMRASYEATELAGQARAANEAKSRFLAMMSHEIRTPLTAMLGTVELLHDTPLDVDQVRYVSAVQGAGETLKNIIDDVLDYSEFEAVGISIDSEPVFLTDMIRDCVQLLEPGARSRNNVLKVSVESQVPDWVEIDRARLHQLLWNVVGNAIKFTQDGCITVRVSREHAAVSAEVERVYFQVEDTGVGIPQDQQAYLFQPFYKAAGDRFRGGGGTGLGLPIVKRIVDAMGGEVGVQSVVGKGTTVWFYLDLPVVSAPAKSGQICVGSKSVSRIPQNRRVLLVEDNQAVRELAQETLEKLGCQVSVAVNGREAVDQVKHHPFDLILMDCQMPVMNGFEATAAIRAVESGRQPTPIVALTAAVMADERQACIDAGMDDVLPKPYSRRKLRAMLERWIG